MMYPGSSLNKAPFTPLVVSLSAGSLLSMERQSNSSTTRVPDMTLSLSSSSFSSSPAVTAAAAGAGCASVDGRLLNGKADTVFFFASALSAKLCCSHHRLIGNGCFIHITAFSNTLY